MEECEQGTMGGEPFRKNACIHRSQRLTLGAGFWTKELEAVSTPALGPGTPCLSLLWRVTDPSPGVPQGRTHKG